MNQGAKVQIREAVSGDLPCILGVQREAFGRVATTLGIDPGDLPPLRETLGDLVSLFEHGTRFLVATTPDGTIVGSVRSDSSHGVVEVGRLVVADGWLRQGIATRLMNRLEATFPEAVSFQLFTGEQATDSLALYEKLGYTVSHNEDVGPVVLVWLAKPGSASKQ